MKIKPLLYFTITSLILAVLGTILQFFTNLTWGKFVLDYSMRMAEIGGILLIVVNGSLLFQTKKIAAIGIAALLTTIGYLLTYLIFVIPILWIAFSLKIIGLATIIWIYTSWFKGKVQKQTLDYLKVLWVLSKIITSLLVVLAATAVAKYFSQVANVLFYTMLIYFIWLALHTKEAEEISLQGIPNEQN
jgi:hypothetical protein